MRSARRAILLVAAVLAVPVFPVLLLGLSFEDQIRDRLAGATLSPPTRFGLTVGLLAIDIFLPVPSSAVSTWAGGVLGLWPATLASTLGMTAGSCVGFALARAFGHRFTRRFSSPDDLDRTAALSHRLGPAALAVTRALPILAEACVLLVGAAGLTWRRFLPPVVLGNVAVSLVYCACGAYFRGKNAFPWAVAASGTVPLAVALLARRRLAAAPAPADRAGP
jgi:membrane protein DedA with SNARE-associated domain